MNEDRLKQIERHVCEEMSFGCFGCVGLNELIAEIRRRGEMVDALLEKQPIVNDGDTGIYCGYCSEMLGYCDAERCAFERILQARDWEPVTREAVMVEGG